MGPRGLPSEDRSITAAGPPSTADAQLVDERPIALGVLLLDVLEEAPPLADQHQQAPAGVVVLHVRLEVLGEPVDALGQERDLDLGRPGVALVSLELRDQALLAVDGK